MQLHPIGIFIDGPFLRKKLPGSVMSVTTSWEEIAPINEVSGAHQSPIQTWKRINWGLELQKHKKYSVYIIETLFYY